MKTAFKFVFAMIGIMGLNSLNAQITKGKPSLLPPELTSNSTTQQIEFITSPGSFLVFDMTKIYVNVGKLKSTPVKTDVETVQKVRDNMRSFDVPGGTWNSIFRNGKEFSSEKFNAAGEQNRFIEYDMKLKKEIAATISAVVYHNYSGTVRKRTSTSSSSTRVTNYEDTVALRANIKLHDTQSELKYESLAIRNSMSFFEGKITFKGKEYLIQSTQSDNSIMPLKFSNEGKCLAGIQSGVFGNELLLSNDIDEELKVALSCVAGLQMQVFAVANSTRLED
jgi:hypothetical protein